jgi:hypothetical protein
MFFNTIAATKPNPFYRRQQSKQRKCPKEKPLLSVLSCKNSGF